VADGLFDINIGACFAGRDGNQGMPVVGRGVYHNLRFYLVEQLSVVLILCRLIAGEFFYFAYGWVENVFVHIAHRDDFTNAIF